MVEEKSLPVPYAYMRSVILAIRAYPGLKPVVANTLVPKLVEREIWNTQPRVWEGLILLPKYIGTRELTEKMNEALFTLPTSLLQDLLKKNPDIRPILAAHATRSRKNVGLDVAKRKVLGLSPFSSSSTFASSPLVLQAAADDSDENGQKKKTTEPARREMPPPTPLSDNMRQKLLNEARGQGADYNTSNGNPILLIAVVIGVLVVLGGKGFFY
ncbi:hypothetical protein NSK_005595 [Nannochloropsis salina CCMP1776]|uniref:Symplekin C-terminal domain-containing protein n=2 Tax=Nannochloropsis salina CCMP1776 TaxID=1027361 RepID=A0A4D9CZL2_9STRA|nr:hypothetical protein NSK_005595 [Nannochloropsis salina CCMP1776]|eukprot:TFJ83073.1 hypothetical protein NSK_005595 [Nannochloropsis salina CCMP1776]